MVYEVFDFSMNYCDRVRDLRHILDSISLTPEPLGYFARSRSRVLLGSEIGGGAIQNFPESRAAKPESPEPLYFSRSRSWSQSRWDNLLGFGVGLEPKCIPGARIEAGNVQNKSGPAVRIPAPGLDGDSISARRL